MSIEITSRLESASAVPSSTQEDPPGGRQDRERDGQAHDGKPDNTALGGHARRSPVRAWTRRGASAVMRWLVRLVIRAAALTPVLHRKRDGKRRLRQENGVAALLVAAGGPPPPPPPRGAATTGTPVPLTPNALARDAPVLAAAEHAVGKAPRILPPAFPPRTRSSPPRASLLPSSR